MKKDSTPFLEDKISNLIDHGQTKSEEKSYSGIWHFLSPIKRWCSK